MNRQTAKEQWSSRWGLVMAATAAAAGLGNVWKFPYIVGEHGGGAFMLVYLAAIVVVGLPILSAELFLGRLGTRNVVDGLAKVAREGNHSRHWASAGWIGIVAVFVILSFYSVVGGWSLAYVHLALTGATSPGVVAPDYFTELFSDLTGDPVRTVFWHSVFMGLTAYIVGSGVRRGIERVCRFLVPILLLLLAAIAIHSAVVTNQFSSTLRFLFEPDFSKLTVDAVLVAVGHAFFSLSVGVGAMLTFGAYVPRGVSLPAAAVTIAALDTVVAILAGLAIFPVVFAHGLDPSAGPGLAFIAMPVALNAMDIPSPLSLAFFGALAIAALTSSPSLLEPIVELVRERTGWSRRSTANVLALGVWAAGLAQTLSLTGVFELDVLGLSLFDASDYLASSILLPVGGILIAFFAGWKLSAADATSMFGGHKQIAYRVWRFALRFVAPLAIALVLASGL